MKIKIDINEDSGEAFQKVVDQYTKSSLQYGHEAKKWNPKMASYISHEKEGYHIIDLAQTFDLLKLAAAALKKQAKKKTSKFLFVGTNEVSSSLVEKYAKEVNANYINYRWLGGMLTNWPTIEKKIRRLKALNYATNEKMELNYSKKKLNAQKKEQNRLNNLFSGIENMSTLPDVAIFASQLKDHLAIQECIKLGITCVAISDTNCNPNLVPYPIPANDDSFISVDFILKSLAYAIKLGSTASKT